MPQKTLLVDNSTKRAVLPQHKIRKLRLWSPKQRRAYHRIMSGYKLSQYLGARLRFMTLTTSHIMKRDFNTLVKRIRRRYGQFDYIRISTTEGNGVLHILYRGSFIPRKWLQSQWKDIHLSWNVDIRDTQRYHCAYVVNQYLVGQSSFIRYSMTWAWVWKGFATSWKELKDSFWRNPVTGIRYHNRKPVNLIDLWNDALYKHARSRFTQTVLYN